GRGVFATHKIEAGTVVDTEPVIILNKEQFDNYIQHSVLLHYSYLWNDREIHDTLGNCSRAWIHVQSLVIANRTSDGSKILGKEVIVYTALRDIPEGEELLISYRSHLTFEDVEAAQTEEGEDVTDVLARIDI
ncbi:hypothetical protein B9Z19DRAFT_960637, partial [Tuber borchii]